MTEILTLRFRERISGVIQLKHNIILLTNRRAVVVPHPDTQPPPHRTQRPAQTKPDFN